MSARAASLVLVATALCACGAPSTSQRSAASPASPTPVYLGSLGTAGCKPAAAFHGWKSVDGFPEAGTDSRKGSFWALVFTSVPPPAKKDVKVVWRMTGSGEFRFLVTDADGKSIPLAWGPDVHGGSNWSHPGDEVGTGINFPHGGCWDIHVARANVTGDLWFDVTS